MSHIALEIVGCAFLAPGHCEFVDLAAVHHVGNGLRRITERNRQHARRQRVKRAGVTALLRLEQPLDLGNGFGGAEIDRLIKDQPTGDRAALRFTWF